MKRYLTLTAFVIAGLVLTTLAAAADLCSLPAGNYDYLYSDDVQAFYTGGRYTIRIDSADGALVQTDDFDSTILGYRYQRSADVFRFTDLKGVYTKRGRGPIEFEPTIDTLALAIGFLAVGATYTDDTGTYRKQTADRVVFEPALEMPDLVLSPATCARYTLIASGAGVAEALANLSVKREGTDLVVNLMDDVLFEYGQHRLTSQAEERLEALADLINRERGGYVLVTGHTDSHGSRSDNLALSTQRAESVGRWLIANAGLQSADLMMQGLGEDAPVAPNTLRDGRDNPQGRAQNRRVEVVIQTERRDPQYLRERHAAKSTDSPVPPGDVEALEQSVGTAMGEAAKALGALERMLGTGIQQDAQAEPLPGRYDVSVVAASGAVQVYEVVTDVTMLRSGGFFIAEDGEYTYAGGVRFTTAGGQTRELVGTVNLERVD